MTNRTVRHILLMGMVLSNCWVAASQAEQVSIRLHNGKSFRAELDQRTGEQRLWLRFGGGSTIVLRSIPWDELAAATRAGKRLSPAELRELAAQPQDAPRPAPEPVPPPAFSTAQPSHADQARRLLGMRPRVTDVQFDASLANWDRDVETDGLLLRIWPTDSRGIPVAVNAIVEVELIAMKTVPFHHAPQSRGQLPRRLGRWTKRLDAREFAGHAGHMRLPFQADHPEFDTTWAPHCLVHVRLVAPGHGVFERSIDGVRVRPFAPFRDALERQSNRRFLPNEETSANP